MVRLKATSLDVYVHGVRAGYIIDCGDCWRAGIYRTRGKSAKGLLTDFDSRADAVTAVVSANFRGSMRRAHLDQMARG
jgi:hypothetical protein